MWDAWKSEYKIEKIGFMLKKIEIFTRADVNIAKFLINTKTYGT